MISYFLIWSSIIAEYQLKAFISHMGSSTAVGHYVCHILKEGKWVIYNDEKVAMSENPPKDLGYVYMYERMWNIFYMGIGSSIADMTLKKALSDLSAPIFFRVILVIEISVTRNYCDSFSHLSPVYFIRIRLFFPIYLETALFMYEVCNSDFVHVRVRSVNNK